MPVYEYKCGRGHQYEKIEGFDAPSRHACPHCGEQAGRIFSPPAVIFKGSGFYSTDNRRTYQGVNGASNSNGASASEDTTSSGDESKTESASTGAA